MICQLRNPQPTTKTCDICCMPAIWIIMPTAENVVSYLCQTCLDEFQRLWLRSDIERATRTLPKVRQIVNV